MFNVTHTLGEVRVEFSYPATGLTKCLIIDDIIENDIIAHGYSQCHPNDQFEKNKGRKYALRNALNIIPRIHRKPFWEAYFKARNGKF